MFKLFIVITTFTLINAAGYGTRLGLEQSLANSGLSGGLNTILNSGRFSSLSNGFSNDGYVLGSGGRSSGTSGPIQAAIESRRNVEIIPVHIPQERYEPQIIEIPANELPVAIIFRSKSSPVLVEQRHTPGAPGEVQESRSEEEPHTLRHEVIRPVIQELREVIQPYRQVVQQIQPVIEEIHQVVTKGEQRQNSVPALELSPGISSIGRGLSGQQLIGSLGGQQILGSLGGQRLAGNLNDLKNVELINSQKDLATLSDQKSVEPINGIVLKGALSGLILDNGLTKVDNFESNLFLTNTLPVNLGMIGTKYLEKRTALNSVLSKATRKSSGVEIPRVDLGGVQYLFTGLAVGSDGSLKLLNDSSSAKSKAKAA